jgi:hypothetical protein
LKTAAFTPLMAIKTEQSAVSLNGSVLYRLKYKAKKAKSKFQGIY